LINEIKNDHRADHPTTLCTFRENELTTRVRRTDAVVINLRLTLFAFRR
jgi:hypothetical protein